MSIELVSQLRHLAALRTGSGYQVRPILGSAADEIERLHEALRPFVFGDPIIEQLLFGAMDDGASVTFTIKLGDCRRARAAISAAERGAKP